MPWQVYARPFDRGDDRPRVAIIVSNEGDLDNNSMAQALNGSRRGHPRLSPYTKGSAAEWLAKARASGHETLLGVPMEAAESAPGDSGGPLTLRADLDDAANQKKLEESLGKAVGYVGILPLAAGRLMSAPERLLPVLEIVKRRGLLFVDTGAQGQAAAAALPKVKVSRPAEGISRARRSTAASPTSRRTHARAVWRSASFPRRRSRSSASPPGSWRSRGGGSRSRRSPRRAAMSDEFYRPKSASFSSTSTASSSSRAAST